MRRCSPDSVVRHLRRSRAGALLFALALCLLPGRVTAQPTDRLERQLQDLLDQAMEFYDTLELEQSVEVLNEAIDLAEEEAYEDWLLADLYIMLGIVEHALTSDPEVVVDYFVTALTIDADAELNPYYATPTLEHLLENARDQVAAEGPPDGGDHGAPAQALVHSPIVTVRKGDPIEVSATVDDRVAVRDVSLSYRAYGQSRYRLEDMTPMGNNRFAGEIPSSATQEGIQLEYFLEAYDASGELVGSAGTANSPNVVVILGEADGGPSEGPGGRHVSLALGIGTGGGLASGEPLVMGNQVDLNPGIALTPLHFYFDALYHFGNGFEFGPFVRFQTVLLQNGIEPEVIVGGKFKWYFEDLATTRMYVSVGGGYGYVRHTVDLNPTIDFVDTTQEGPGHAGVGFGVAYMFTDNIGLLNDFYTMVLFDQVSVQLDYNLGLLLAF